MQSCLGLLVLLTWCGVSQAANVTASSTQQAQTFAASAASYLQEPGPVVSTILLAGLIAWALSKLLAQETVPAGKKLPPGKMGLIPFLGDDTLPFVGDVLTYQRGVNAKYGPIAKTRILGEPTVFVADESSVRKLLMGEHDLVEADWPTNWTELLGPFAINSLKFQQHTRMRKLIQRPFTPKSVAGYLPTFQRIAKQHLDSWAQTGTVRGYDEVKKFTLHVALRIILGFDDSNTTPEALEHFNQNFQTFTAGFLALPFNIPGTAMHRGMRARAELLRIIEANLDKLLAANDARKHVEEGVALNALQLLLSETDEDGNGFSMPELKDTCLMLMFAGHDTSASTITGLLAALCRHPDVLARLREEQKQVMQQHGEEISQEALKEMPYADAVIKEHMRINWTIAGVLRRALQPLDLGGYYIPKGWKIIVNLWHMLETDHRWADDDPPLTKFVPERFLSERARQPGPYLPFGIGQRGCLGQHLALTEIKMFLVLLVRGYEFSMVNPNEEFKVDPMPTPLQGLMMEFRALNN